MQILAHRRRPHRDHGQVLPLFALCLVAILAMTALLIDGASALETRRNLQNAGDAAALAGANQVQAAGSIHACSSVDGPPPGAPRADVVAAVQTSLAANVPGFDPSGVTITCPDGYDNQAVKVALRAAGANFFASAVIGAPLDVGTSSVAVNGQITGSLYSVIELDPWNSSWPNGRRGCPSVLFSGGPTVRFDGSIQINSACPASNGGALATNGNAASLSMGNGARFRIVGGYSPSALTLNPAPLTGQPILSDPLELLEAVPWSSFTVRSSSQLVLNNQTVTLQPGVYRGGIQLKNSSKAFLKPGIYVLDGGGLDVGAQAQVCSINASATPVDCTTWAASCTDGSCGVLLFNRGTASGAGAMDEISVAAGATLKLKAYDEAAAGNQYAQYRNLLIWQDKSPVPTSSYEQPPIYLNGGGNVDIGGTIYAPSAMIHMGGGSGGSGGSVTLTVQFISWDLEIQGNASFHFLYNDNEFARPTDYGLVE
jgi:Flp pilus assembly protein TadG